MVKSLLGNQSEMTFSLNNGSQVNDFISVVQAINPELGELLLKKKILISVNHEIAHGETELTSNDEIALLPPFAGGAQC